MTRLLYKICRVLPAIFCAALLYNLTFDSNNPAYADEPLSTGQREEIETIIHDYLMKNPEKLIELLSVLQCKPQTSVLIFEVLLRYCTYDKRKRLNSNQLLMKIFLS